MNRNKKKSFWEYIFERTNICHFEMYFIVFSFRKKKKTKNILNLIYRQDCYIYSQTNQKWESQILNIFSFTIYLHQKPHKTKTIFFSCSYKYTNIYLLNTVSLMLTHFQLQYYAWQVLLFGSPTHFKFPRHPLALLHWNWVDKLSWKFHKFTKKKSYCVP